LIDCTRTLCEKTVTKENSARQALISVQAETSNRHFEPCAIHLEKEILP
jgi:hypothetical protein